MKNKVNLFLGVLVGLLLASGLLFLSIKTNIFGKKFTLSPVGQKTEISGKIDFNGPADQGETIALGFREAGENKFTIFSQGLPTQDGLTWIWNEAKEGKSYDLQAYLQLNGGNLVSSSIVTVTAPAKNETLAINTQPPTQTLKDLPAEISGTFDLNGFIPEDSLVDLIQILSNNGQPEEETIMSDIKVKDMGVWSWDSAKRGIYYQLKALLKDGDEVIGQSDIISVTAPALHEVLVINSQAKIPEPAKTEISGTIDLNGMAPGNSRIVLLQKAAGTEKFAVASDLIWPKDQEKWSWKEAEVGREYELMAVLKVSLPGGGEQDAAQSQVLQVTAPAKNEILKINVNNMVVDAPPKPTVKCASQDSQGNWNIEVHLKSIPGAKQYWLEIGTRPARNDFMNTRFFQKNLYDDQIVNANIPSQKYYTRWAYSGCSDCKEKSSFSIFSEILSFSCP